MKQQSCCIRKRRANLLFLNKGKVAKYMSINIQTISFSSFFTRLSFVALLSFVYSTCYATLDIMDEEDEGYYGNANIRPFKDIREGADTLTPRDRAYLQSVEETRVTERWYMRALIGHPRVRLTGMSNKSSPNSSVPSSDTYVVGTPDSRDNIYQLLLAGGKVWEHWGIEGELLLSKKLNYSSTPFLVPSIEAAPGIESMTADISVYALFINAQYIIPRWVSFYPKRLQIHLDAGVGPTIKSTNVNTYDAAGLPTDTNSTRTFSVAGMLGVGARYQLAEHFLVDVSYRYYDLGKTKIDPIQVGSSTVSQQQRNMMFQADKMRSSGMFIGLTFQV